MSRLKIKNIVFIGAGNMATNLALGLKKNGFEIVQVFSRTNEHAKILARKVDGEYCTNLDQVLQTADLYIISVADSVLEEIAGKIKIPGGVIVHTSGSIPMDVLRGCADLFGVFYSPQTFVKKNPVDLDHVPICFEGNNETTTELLKGLAGQLSDSVYNLNSTQRKMVHLAAVFAGNFSNFMYVAAEELLTRNDLPFDLLHPIIRQTAENAWKSTIFDFQTGPAVREDMKILSMHVDMLSDYPEFRELYELISRNIIKYKRKNEQL